MRVVRKCYPFVVLKQLRVRSHLALLRIHQLLLRPRQRDAYDFEGPFEFARTMNKQKMISFERQKIAFTNKKIENQTKN